MDKLVSYGAPNIWVSTFHSSCVRFLRRYINLLDYGRNFTIYDTDDTKSLLHEVCKVLNIDTKTTKERSLQTLISAAKNALISPEDFLKQAAGDFDKEQCARVYAEYQKRLKANNALDFDDIIFLSVELFKSHPEALEYYQRRFRYIMVDEYQDTNPAQFELMGKHGITSAWWATTTSRSTNSAAQISAIYSILKKNIRRLPLLN